MSDDSKRQAIDRAAARYREATGGKITQTEARQRVAQATEKAERQSQNHNR